MTITIGSLCSGYGGLDRAAVGALGGPARAELIWHAEHEDNPSAIKVHDQHWPGLPNVGDITSARWSTWRRPDVLVMGPPCQPVSAAGRQKGTDDHRWLWPYALRAIVDLRVPLVLFENVRNLISIRATPDGPKGGLWRSMLDELRAAGYACRWLVVGACAVGAPHHRHRVFLAAWRVGHALAPATRADVTTCGARRGTTVLPTPSAVSYGSNQGGAAGRVGPVRHSLESLARLEMLPTPAARDGDGRGEGDGGYWDRRAREGGRTNGRPLAAAVINLLPTPRASDGKNGGPNQGIASGDVALSSAVIGERWGRYAAAVERWVPIIGRPAPEPTELGPRGGLRLAPALPEWMMGLAEGYLCDHAGRIDALRLAGNGVLPLQGFVAFRALLA